MKIHIDSICTIDRKDFRGWQPFDFDDVLEYVVVKISSISEGRSQELTVRLATPRGLSRLVAKNGVLTCRPLLVIDTYNYEDMCDWIESTVVRCESDTWGSSLEKLERYFDQGSI